MLDKYSHTWPILFGLLVLACPSLSVAGSGQQSANVGRVATSLKRFCFRCHGDQEQEAGLNLPRLLSERPLVRNRQVWRKVIAQLELGGMPPKRANQPDKVERSRLIKDVRDTLKHVDWSAIRNPGRLVARRLSNTEYNHTVRDLLRIKIRPADKFPADLKGSSGFDNSSNTLFIQTLLMEKYILAAGESVAAAFPQPQKKLTGEAARERVERFLLRAFRRPPTPRQMAQGLSQYGRGGMKRLAYVTLLSPHFLMRLERTQDHQGPYRVDPVDLASRLSYFLWSSMPDNRLLDLAHRGNLAEESVLDQQLDRMLGDERAATLGTVFAAQWLGFEHLGTRVRLDPIDNPWCTETLMAAMRAESALFFVSLVKENRSLKDLVAADYTYLNEELAKHYRIRNVRGKKMRRVKMTDQRRGGIFGQGSILAVTSFPDRTSPVMRGKWILSDVLGTPPPEPPPNASALAEKIEEKRGLTFRQKMELHRRDPRCNACHQRIDPLGLSLENFDNFGRWRNGPLWARIDARGELPNGTKFKGPAGLKRVIVSQRMDDLAAQITRKLMSYALGRQLEYYDEPAVAKIVAALKKDGYRMRTLLRGVVHSFPFQYKQNSDKVRKR